MRRLRLSVVLLFSACSVATSDVDPGAETPTPDPGSDPDPDPGSDPDPGETDDCPPSDLGYLGVIPGGIATILPVDERDPDGSRRRIYSGDIDPTMQLRVELWEGYGVFSEQPVEPGSYPVEGDLATCGVCVELSVTTGEVTRTMLATAGTVDLVSVDGDLVGDGNPLLMEERGSTGLPVEGGCVSAIQQVTFAATLEEM